MTSDNHLILGYSLDRQGGGTALSPVELADHLNGPQPVWFHFDGGSAGTEHWLNAHSGLDSYVIESLLSKETRPRCDIQEKGILLNLRGVNLNPGAKPEDMVSIRLWVDENRVISVRFRRILAVEDIKRQIDLAQGPLSTGHLVARLADRLTDRMGPVIDDLVDQLGDLEETMLQEAGLDGDAVASIRRRLTDSRHMAIRLSRYLAPQRHALTTLSQYEGKWINDRVRGRFRDTADRLTRITEELDVLRERSMIVQDELIHRSSQRMERTMYILTMVAAVMLPLGFLTGLLGINVGGMPGVDSQWAFAIVVILCLAIAIGEIWFLRRKRLL
ncbi:MAG: zinc transporter ZntB [Wenzhouxiangella sp.]|jgi:zinc transporter|nr:zinc transporter ZntB [Wenzhouxiangella sp.]